MIILSSFEVRFCFYYDYKSQYVSLVIDFLTLELESLYLKACIDDTCKRKCTETANDLMFNRLKLHQIPLRHLFLATYKLTMAGVIDDELERPGVLFWTQSQSRTDHALPFLPLVMCEYYS